MSCHSNGKDEVFLFRDEVIVRKERKGPFNPDPRERGYGPEGESAVNKGR